MKPKGVPVKTDEGVLEARQRVLGLAPRIRIALLLVDGVRSTDELERMMTAASIEPGALQLLLDKGLIRFSENSGEQKPPASARATAPQPQPSARHPGLTVASLADMENILGVATDLEVKTVLNVATKLETTPTPLLAPHTATKAPASTLVHLPPLAEADRAFKLAAEDRKPAVPAALARMNLMVARAHVANALDQHLEIDGYGLKLGVVACESREELERMLRLVEGALTQKLDKYASARIVGVARALLER